MWVCQYHKTHIVHMLVYMNEVSLYHLYCFTITVLDDI